MSKGKRYPKGCTDLGRLFNHVDREEATRRKREYLNSRKEEKPSADEPKK